MITYQCPTCFFTVSETDYAAGRRLHPDHFYPLCQQRPETYHRLDLEQISTATLFTLGYAGHTPALKQEGFVAWLQEQQIAFVVDVRRNPTSHKPGFAGSALHRALEQPQIGYWSARMLGTPVAVRNALWETGDLADFFEGVRRHLQTDRAAQWALRSVVALLADRQRVALLCTELRAEDCHRSVVAEEVFRLVGGAPALIHL